MDGVIDRLYTTDGAALAANWLWENRTTLHSNLKTSAPVAMYAAVHAMGRFADVSEGWQTTAADAEFIGLTTEFAEANGHYFSEATQGLGAKLLVQALVAIALKLIEELLEQQG